MQSERFGPSHMTGIPHRLIRHVPIRHHANVTNVISGQVADAVMGPRQQKATFQVLDRCLEGNATPSRSTIGSIDNILCRHGPSWAKRPMLTVVSNALLDSGTIRTDV
jgi:hypothetical protein